MMKPSASFVLLVGDDGIFLLPPQGAQPLFAAKDETAAVLKILKATPRAEIILLADCVAQDYKRETLPPVSLFDLRKLLARRLEQAFPKTPLRQALRQKDGQALLAGLDPEGCIGFWLEELRAAALPPPSISLLPVESAAMAACLAPEASHGWVLLLSHHRTGGFRQIVAQNGELVFTRLTPPLAPTAHADSVAETLAQDLEATRAYLARMGLGEETSLKLVAILPSVLHASFAKRKTAFSNRLVLSPREAAARLGLRLPAGSQDFSGEAVHALWLQSRTKRQTKLMLPEDRAFSFGRKMRQAGFRAAALFGSLAVLIVLFQAYQLWDAVQTNARLGNELAVMEDAFENAKTGLAKEAAPLERLRKAVERRRLFTRQTEGPADLVALLTPILPQDVRAVGLDWTREETRIDFLLTGEESEEKVPEMARQRVRQAFDNLLPLFQETLPDMKISIARYPFPSLPNETITNREAGPLPDLTATFVFRKGE